MKDHSRDESAARDAANLAGRVEDFGGGVGDQSPNPLLDERFRCVICEHGHQGHICRWCVAAGKAAS